ncbi:evasin P1181-like [Dermacentor silvarum]|uniref:evasin P1181-like n=1 Tax=Dermacentor silvarum TaxID=543639 RepID=UPI002100FF84|nr:evasin P1181-like [Dermacentor silvarum]
MALSLCAFVVVILLSQVMPAVKAQSTDCSPMLLYTHGKPIRVGCKLICTRSQHNATVTQEGVECTNITSEVAGKMQRFLGYYCPVGWCNGENCVLSGLYVECWNTESRRKN